MKSVVLNEINTLSTFCWSKNVWPRISHSKNLWSPSIFGTATPTPPPPLQRKYQTLKQLQHKQNTQQTKKKYKKTLLINKPSPLYTSTSIFNFIHQLFIAMKHLATTSTNETNSRKASDIDLLDQHIGDCDSINQSHLFKVNCQICDMSILFNIVTQILWSRWIKWTL